MGYPANVAQGDPISSTWHNEVKNQTIFRFANTSARASAITTPTEGMVSYLDDTDAVEVYSGTAWRKPWNLPWGQVAAPVTGTAQTGITTSATDLTGLSISYSGYIGRQLLLQASVPCYNSAAVGSLYFYDGATAIYQNSFGLPNASNPFTVMLTSFFTTTATTHTLKVAASITGGSLNIYDTGDVKPKFIVTDIGPA